MKERYPIKGYRLHPETIKTLEQLKKESGLSYNRLIFRMIKTYQKKA